MRILGLFLIGTAITSLLSCSVGGVSATSGIGATGGEILVEIRANSNCLRRGEALALQARVTNNSREVVVSQTKDKPVLDILVVDDPPHRWSDGKPLTSEATRFELKPGESRTIEWNWNGNPTRQSVFAYAEFTYGEFQPIVVKPSILINYGTCPSFMGP